MRGFLIASTLTFVCLLAVAMSVHGATITVARDGSGDYRSIGDAVDNMNPGDDIYVKDGTYFEALEITNKVVIVGQSTEGVIIDANSTDTPIVLSTADDSYLANMTLMNGTSGTNEAGLSLFNCDGVVLNNLSFYSNNVSGLVIYGSSDIDVNDSISHENRGPGITIIENSNNVRLNGLHVWNNSRYGVEIRNSDDMQLTNLDIHNNSYGIYIYSCFRIEIHRVASMNNSYGIYSSTSYGIEVQRSTIVNNTNYGVYAASTKIFLYNSTVDNSDNLTNEFYTSEGFIAVTNCTLHNISVLLGVEGMYCYKNFVHVQIDRKGSPQSGADVNASENEQEAYASEGYGGTDPKTGPSGNIMWIPLGYYFVDDTATLYYNNSWVGASYKGWSVDREVNMSATRMEYFNYSGANILNVDDDNYADPSMDGSVDHPYDTITRAVDNATAWDEIVVWDGIYDENVTINLTLSVEGNGTLSVVNGWLELGTNATDTYLLNLTLNGTDVVVNVNADDIILDRLYVNATGLGINVTGDRLLLSEANITADTGIRVNGVSGTEIVSSVIEAVTDGIVLQATGATYLNDSHIWNFTNFGVDLDNAAIDISGTNITVGAITPGTNAINANSSQAFVQDSEFWTDGGDSIVLASSNVTVLNSTFDGDNVDVDGTSALSVRNYLDIYVNKSSGEDAEGVDVNVTVDGVSIYNTTYYNGTDPQTDENGMVGGIIVENQVYDGSSTPTWRNVTIRVRYSPSAETEWTNVTYNVDMNTSHLESFTYVAPSVNRKPWTETDTPVDEVSENVEIDYTLFDKESDPCNVYVEYSIDGFTWLPATLQGGGSNISGQSSGPSGVSHSFVWRSYLDVPDKDIDFVLLRLWANDTKEGYQNESKTFHLDNDLNAPTIEIDALAGEQSGSIMVYFNITDPEERRSKVMVEYLYNGSWSAAYSGGGGNTSANMRTNASGEPYVFQWRSSDDIDGVDDNITLRITGNDGNDDDNGTPDDITFHLDNNAIPDVDLKTSSAEKSEAFDIEFELIDEESDTIDLVVMYRLDAGDDFEEATINDPVTGLESSSGGTDHTLEWDSETDIGEIETEYAEIKIFTYDADEGGNDTVVYHVDNDLDPPEITDIILPNDLFGDIEITFTISDDQEAYSSVTVTYQVGSGIQKDATITSTDAIGNRLVNLETSVDGEEYTFTWNSNDPDDFEKVYQEDVTLILVAEDGQDAPDRSSDFEEGPFDIENHLYLPRITSVDVSGDKKDIEIDYTIAHQDAVDCDLGVQYKTENNPTWKDATMGDGGDGYSDLASSAAGVGHTFIWDSFVDLANVTEEVTLRVRAETMEDLGEWVESGMFDLNNILNVKPELQSLGVQNDHGEITVSFQVRDDDDVQVNASLYYKYGSYNKATVAGNTTDLASGTTWTTHELVWDSFVDLGYVDATGLEIEIRVSDGTTNNKTSATFDLKNGQIPRLVLEDPDLGKGTVYLNFTLEDDQSDDCDVEFEYSADLGDTFDAAMLITTYPGESPSDMISSSSGEEHFLIWNAFHDLDYGLHQDLIVRLRADDGWRNSVWTETDPFELNIAAPPNEEPEGDIFPPGEVNETDDIVIRVEVTDDTEDITVTLFYRNLGASSWDDVEMDEGEEDDIYEATILNAYVNGTDVQYYIEIDDGEHVVYAEDKDEDSPMTATIYRPDDTGGTSDSDETDIMPFIIILVIVGAAAAVGLLLFFKKKGGGKPKGADGVAQPGGGLQPAMQHPPGAMGHPQAHGAHPPAHGGHPQAPQGGAQMSVCPVCGAPVMVPPQRPVRVSCNRCNNSFDVK